MKRLALLAFLLLVSGCATSTAVVRIETQPGAEPIVVFEARASQ